MTATGSILLKNSNMRLRLLTIALMKTVLMVVTLLSLQFFVPDLIDGAYADCSSKPAQNVNWEGCRKRNLVLSGNDLGNGKFRQTNFAFTDMRTTRIGGADFSKAVLVRAVFDGSSARQAIFEKAIGYRASFQHADLSDAVFRKSKLTRVDFSGSILTGADFSKSDAGRIILEGAIMGNNDFSFANIARADFRKAVVKGAIEIKGAFSFQTRFEGVDLTKFEDLQQRQVDIACGSETTVLPAGLHRPASWSVTPNSPGAQVQEGCAF